VCSVDNFSCTLMGGAQLDKNMQKYAIYAYGRCFIASGANMVSYFSTADSLWDG
jgi:hypothetical protein